MKLKTFIRAARLRTLPLSVSGIVMGSALAYSQGVLRTDIFVGALITTILLQVLSNFANDYGDGVKGTDNHNRIGPERALQSGKVTRNEMKIAIVLTALLALLAAITLISKAFGKNHLSYTLVFIGLGIASVVAAIKYTVGKSAYGYRGLGDLFVFLFFGWLSVLGSYFLYTHQLPWKIVLPASSVGFLSVAVLNLNNMRDYENDKAVGKNTLVVKIGTSWAKYYHYYLVVLAMLLMLIYSVMHLHMRWKLLYLLAFLPLTLHLIRVKKNQELNALDKELKVVAFSTFLLSVLFFVGQLLS